MADFYLEHEYWFAVVQLVLAMLGMGATLRGRDFADLLQAPTAVTLGLVVQLLVVPLTALLFIRLAGLAGGVAVGIALLAAMPGGTGSNIFTYFARGSIALSICITALTTLICLVSTPLILSALAAEYMPPDFTMPRVRIITEIGLTLLLPLCLGMLYLYLFPNTAGFVAKWSIRGSVLGIALIVVGSLSAGRLDLYTFGFDNTLRVVAFAAVLWGIGWVAPRLRRLSRPDATAIEIEVILRNINLAVLVKASLFPAATAATGALGDMVLLTVLFYGSVELTIGAALIGLRRPRPTPGAKPRTSA